MQRNGAADALQRLFELEPEEDPCEHGTRSPTMSTSSLGCSGGRSRSEEPEPSRLFQRAFECLGGLSCLRCPELVERDADRVLGRAVVAMLGLELSDERRNCSRITDVHERLRDLFPGQPGRLYYHLEPTYGEPATLGEGRKAFFTLAAGKDRNCVNFPLLEAVLAGLWQQQRRDLWAIRTALVSLVIALASLAVSITAIVIS